MRTFPGSTPILSSAKPYLPLLLVVLLSGCLSARSYVDTALPVVQTQDLKSTSIPGPTQLLVEFRTRGTPNAAGTERFKPNIIEVVTKSRLFSEVSETPVPEGRTLSIVIDNVAIDENAASKGFATGLTFGLVGTMVSDGYVCTANYSVPGKASRVVTINHALHTTIGNASGPPGVPGMTPVEAVRIVIEQLTLSVLTALNKDGL